MAIPYFVADSARVTILRPLASSAFGSYSLTLPEGIDLEDVHDFEAPGNELGHVATLTRARRVGGLARRFVRADVAVTAADPSDPDWFPESNVDAVLEDAATRVSSDFFLESNITKAGLGPWVPFVDFKVGDKARVNIWGIIVTLPVTRIEPIISDHDVVDWLVHLGGQLVSDDDAREVENENLRKAFLQDRRELAGIEGQVKAVDKKAEDAKSAADTAKGTADTAKQIAEQSKEASDGALTGTSIEYAVGTSEESPPTSGWSTSTPHRPSGSFIWMRTQITYGSGQSEVTSPVLVTGNTGAPGADGTDGTAGKDGLGIQSTVVSYAVGPSGTVAPTSGWSDQVPPLAKGQYLWTRTVWTYTDNSTETGHSVSYIAQDGNDGDDGLPGKDGVGIASTVHLYAVSSSGTVAPTSGWVATPPAAQPGQFMWTRTIWTYTDGTTETGHAIGKIGDTGQPGRDGLDGEDGLPGKDGVGLSSTLVEYALHTSGTIAPASGWSTTVPTLVKGRYLWTRTTWTYTDNSTETGHSVSYIPTDGSDGEDGLPGKDGVGITGTTITYAKSSSGTTAPTTGWASQPPVTNPGDYIWTRTVWSYSDGTTETGYSVGRIGLKGDKGDTGSPGKGISSTATAYASSASGTTTPTAGWTTSIPVVPEGHFLWTRTTLKFTDGADSVSYAVSHQGADGANGTPGLPGDPGADGRTSYFHTAYANSSDGTAGFSTTDPTGRTYVGTYSDFTEADSTDPSRYTWQLVKGTDGAPGKGVDTVTITYASSSSGTQAPTTGWQTTMPLVPQGHFLWTRTLTRFTDGATTMVDMVARQGVDGEKGTPGVPGHDGRTPFLHVAYANSPDGTVDFSTTNPAGRAYLGTYTDYATLDIYSDVYTDSYGTSTPLDSTDPGRYSWALIKGTDGNDGADGADGVSVAGMTIYYRLVSRDSPPPPRPTVATPSGWTATEPDYQSGTTLYQVIKVTYSNGAFAYTDVSRVSAYMAAASAMEVAEDGVARAKDINAALTGSIDGDLTAAMADSGTAIGAVADAATTARDWTVENQQDFNNTVALANAAQAKVNDVNLINWETQAERNALQTEIDEAQNVALRLQENAIKWASILAVRIFSTPNLSSSWTVEKTSWVSIYRTPGIGVSLGTTGALGRSWLGTLTIHYVNEYGQSVMQQYDRTVASLPDWGLTNAEASGEIRDVTVTVSPWKWGDPRQFVFPYSRGGTAFDPVATYDDIPHGPVRNPDSSYTFEFAVMTDSPVMLSPDNGATWFQVPAGSNITAGYWVLPVQYTDGPARRVITFTEVSTG